MTFDTEKALAFEGESGPYILYTCARINSVFKKSDFSGEEELFIDKLGDDEFKLVKVIKNYPDIIVEAANKYKPSMLANYLLELAQEFNEFYHNCRIVDEDEEIQQNRLIISYMVLKVLEDGLENLNIETLEEM